MYLYVTDHAFNVYSLIIFLLHIKVAGFKEFRTAKT